jgi:hypothetical protein
VAGGRPIPTTTNATLPDGLRAAAVEVLRHDGRPSIGRHCPRLTPLNAHDKPIGTNGKAGGPQAFRLPSTRQWEAPARPPSGVCGLTATQLPRETVAYQGAVATRIQPYRGLLGRALLSCAGAWLVVEEEDDIGLKVPVELLESLQATIRL